MKHLVRFLTLLTSILMSCSNEGGDERNDALYFPLEVGRYWIYEVEGTDYALGDGTDFNYQLRVLVTDVVEDLNGDVIFVLQRSTRNTEEEAWQAEATWSAKYIDAGLLINEGNVPVIHLGFPAKKNRTWDANYFNASGSDDYEITASGASFELGNGEVYNQAVIVQQEDKLTLIDQDQRKEVFAYRVGLIYKESMVLEFDQSGNQIPQSGQIYRQELIEQGSL